MMGTVLWQVGLHTDVLQPKFVSQNSLFIIHNFIMCLQTHVENRRKYFISMLLLIWSVSTFKFLFCLPYFFEKGKLE